MEQNLKQMKSQDGTCRFYSRIEKEVVSAQARNDFAYVGVEPAPGEHNTMSYELFILFVTERFITNKYSFLD